jgi:hypothetical protein
VSYGSEGWRRRMPHCGARAKRSWPEATALGLWSRVLVHGVCVRLSRWPAGPRNLGSGMRDFQGTAMTYTSLRAGSPQLEVNTTNLPS